MKKAMTPLLAVGLALPLAATAQDLNYNFIQGGAAFYPSFEDQDFFGLDAKGSFLVTDDIFVFGGVKFLTDDVDLTAAHIGAGWRYPLARNTDVYGGVSLEYQDVEATIIDPDSLTAIGTASEDETSVGVRGGLRHMLTDDFEVAGEVRLVTGDMDYFGVTGTAQYFLTEQIGLIGEIDIYDGEMGVIGGARFNF